MWYEVYASFRTFFAEGGPLVRWIFVVSLILTGLILERAFYLVVVFPKLRTQIVKQWMRETNKRSWDAHARRRRLISIADIRLQANLNIIRALTAVCPLLGILGTVTGMILVFETMSISGTGSARGMASGISQATLPTMAGLVVAIFGLLSINGLERIAAKRKVRIEDALVFAETTAKD